MGETNHEGAGLTFGRVALLLVIVVSIILLGAYYTRKTLFCKGIL
jgi:hypothetical protein